MLKSAPHYSAVYSGVTGVVQKVVHDLPQTQNWGRPDLTEYSRRQWLEILYQTFSLQAEDTVYLLDMAKGMV